MLAPKWYGNLSNRAIYVTILLCLVLLYVSYSFNACLVARINRVFATTESARSGGRPAFSRQPEASGPGADDVNASVLKLFGSFVRIVPLTGNDSAASAPYQANANPAKYPAANMPALSQPDADASPKYRFLRQQALRPSRHLPHALIIGVKKSGTRALLEFIRLHPDVRAAGCEVHYFDRHYAKGLAWYRAHMPPTIDGQVTMEKTPSYFVTREVPARVHRMNPAARLLVVVRDPVTRAISDYTQAASKKPDMRRFEDLAFPNGTGRAVDTNWGPLRIGVYARHLEWWLQYFPVGQLLFVSGERLIVDPAFEMGRVQDFLGLKRVVTEKHFYFNSTKGFPCLFKSEARSSPHCLGKTKGRNHPYIDPTAVDRLRDFYRPYNARFYQMTGINFGWL